MLTLRDKPGRGRNPLSRRGRKGGTIGIHAGKISQLIRYCYQNNKDFLELTDEDFSRFIYRLRQEKSSTNFMQNQKNENTLTETGRVCLEFLRYIGNLAGRPEFVSENGVIRITLIEYIFRLRSGEPRSGRKIHHHTFSAGEAGEPRKPITDASIQALRDAVNVNMSSRFVNQRRHLHLSFLEYLGPRRGELAEVTLDAIIKAERMKHPMLEMTVFKRGKTFTREVPVTNMLLGQTRRFINSQRSEIIKKFTASGRTDHGRLFISHTTGAPLADTTLNNEIHDLRRTSGIEEKACAHMFRHAFCTNLFVTLFERHRIQNPDAFELRLIGDEILLKNILEWTGHASITGLLPYIRKAFDRITKIKLTLSAGQMALVQREFHAKLLAKVSDLENGILTKENFGIEVRELIGQCEADLRVAEERPSSQ
jgi:integrase